MDDISAAMKEREQFTWEALVEAYRSNATKAFEAIAAELGFSREFSNFIKSEKGQQK